MIDIFDVKSELEGFLMAYQVSLARLRACVDGLTPEQLNWRPPANDANSIAVLATHTMGNMRQNVLGVACGLPDDRDRAAEFASRADDHAELAKRAEDLYGEIEAALADLPQAKLDEHIEHPHRGPTTRRQALLVAARHSVEHIGQMELTRDMAKRRILDGGATVQRLHHAAVIVPTDRLAEARRFYGDLLGLRETERPEADLDSPGVWYDLGENELHIQCRDDAPTDESDRHPAFIIGDVASLKDRLREQGVEVLDAPTLMGRERFFSRDPFGNRLEFMTLPDGNAE